MVDQVTLADVDFIGEGLDRPECVLTTATGDTYTSYRHGVAHVAPDGTTRLIAAKNAPEGFMPNGIALIPGREFLIANLGPTGGVYRMSQDGSLTPVLLEIEGKRMPATNFVGIDRAGRTWITVSTWVFPREQVARKDWADGFVIVMDDKGARIVAEGIGYTNEGIVDPTGQFLYVNETMGRRLSRFPIRPDSSLGDKEVVCQFGAGTFPDGFAYDENGDVWVVSVVSNRVIHVNTKTGKETLVLEDADPANVVAAEHRYQTANVDRLTMDSGRHRTLGNVASIGFGGPDLRTVHLGSLFASRIARFRTSIAGAEPVQWKF